MFNVATLQWQRAEGSDPTAGGGWAVRATNMLLEELAEDLVARDPRSIQDAWAFARE